jgi:dTDP-4-dehydrorhamnose reductase
MKALVLGARGQLGRELLAQGPDRGGDWIGLSRPEIDISDERHTAAMVRQHQPSLIINAAAYTQVDQAESHRSLAFAINRDGPAHLADICSAMEIPLIHVSTDFVFDGSQNLPYREDDPPAPLSIYGQSKLAGEKTVRDRLDRHVIIRTAWLYAVYGHNFVKTILRLAAEKETLRVVDDQHGCPTLAADLAEAILTVADRIQRPNTAIWGTYHYCGRGATTWYGFAQAIVQFARRQIPLKVRQVEAIATDQYPLPARRPANSVLDCSKIEAIFGISTKPWKQRLEANLPAIIAAGPI